MKGTLGTSVNKKFIKGYYFDDGDSYEMYEYRAGGYEVVLRGPRGTKESSKFKCLSKASEYFADHSHRRDWKK